MNLPLKKYSSIFWTLVFLILSANTFAQSSYYWTQNFNTESSLLAGAVVGGKAGASAVFYNPALHCVENLATSFFSLKEFRECQATKL